MRNSGKNRIKEVIQEQGRRNNWIYEQINVKETTFGHWLTNHSQPSIFQLKQIADILGVKMEDLIR